MSLTTAEPTDVTLTTSADETEEPVRLRHEDGTMLTLDVAAWSAVADPVERAQLARLNGPVLDIGCGPGRLVVALAEIGTPAMGVDASPAAVTMAVERNAAALVRSVFDPIPGSGRWRSALLFDGNIGIGGDPARLIARAGQLLALGGRLVVETEGPGHPLRRFQARVERGDAVSEWFPWARLGADALVDLADVEGFTHIQTGADRGRWFVELERSHP